MSQDELGGNYRDLHVLEELCLLSSQRRRRLLVALSDAGEQVSLDALAAALDQVDGDIPTVLHHVDLPKFADADLITYDPDRHLVHVEPPLERVHSHLSNLESHATEA